MSDISNVKAVAIVVVCMVICTFWLDGRLRGPR